MLYTIVIILTLIAAILLIGIVLIQKSKGGGLGSTFASSNSILGVRRTNDVVEKATWYLAAAVALLSILSVFCAPSLTSDLKTTIPATTTPATTAPVSAETVPAAAPAADAAPAATDAAPAATDAAAATAADAASGAE